MALPPSKSLSASGKIPPRRHTLRAGARGRGGAGTRTVRDGSGHPVTGEPNAWCPSLRRAGGPAARCTGPGVGREFEVVTAQTDCPAVPA